MADLNPFDSPQETGATAPSLLVPVLGAITVMNGLVMGCWAGLFAFPTPVEMPPELANGVQLTTGDHLAHRAVALTLLGGVLGGVAALFNARRAPQALLAVAVVQLLAGAVAGGLWFFCRGDLMSAAIWFAPYVAWPLVLVVVLGLHRAFASSG